jgi:hypothetical protein
MFNLLKSKTILTSLAMMLLIVKISSVDGQVTFKNVQSEIGEAFAKYPNGAAWGDIDNDGDLDVYLSIGTSQGHDLMINDLSVSGQFIRADTSMAHFVRTGGPRATVLADIDNDGDLDIIATGKETQNWLIINKFVETGTLWFEDVSEATGIAHVGEYYYGAALADYDNDGNLDIFLAGMANYDWYPSLLCRNISPVGGPLAFEELAEQAGIYSVYGVNMIAGFWGDYDEDGDPDIFVTNMDATPDFLYRNNGDGTFSEVTHEVGMSQAIGDTRFAVWGDFDNDCDLDIFIGRRTYAEQPNMDINQLYRNDGDVFTEIEAARITGIDIYGVSSADYDNDGDLDLHLLNREGVDFLLRNDGNNSFEDVAEVSGLFQIESPDGWGMMGIDDRGSPTWADWDADGDLDLLLPSNSGLKPYLMQNNGGNINNWLQLKLTGIQCNRSAVGARIITISDDLRQMREIYVGSGYSSPPLDVHFGFGQRTIVDSLIIKWPSGTIDKFLDVVVNQILSIEEGSGSSEVNDKRRPVISKFQLLQNYPNPFNSSTIISFTLKTQQQAKLTLYDLLGRKIDIITNREFTAGNHKLQYNAFDLLSGVYFYKIEAGNYIDMKKLILLR